MNSIAIIMSVKPREAIHVIAVDTADIITIPCQLHDLQKSLEITEHSRYFVAVSHVYVYFMFLCLK